jgi:integrase
MRHESEFLTVHDPSTVSGGFAHGLMSPNCLGGSSYAVMGAGQKVIATLLGHSDSATTERYTHVAPSATAALVEARWLRLGGGEGGR